MTIENIKFVEDIIDAALEAYDNACRTKNDKMMQQSIDVINYELAKLDENVVNLTTLPN